jgi:hypothetical protein
MSQFDWPITPKKKKLWRLPKIKGSILKCRVHPLLPTYIGERRKTFAKTYRIQARCYGEHVGEHIENLMGTHWELEGHIVKTHWELGKNEKKSSPTQLEKKNKRKKSKAP